MQEEVNEKTVSLCITGGKVTVRLLKQAMMRFLVAIEKEKAEKARKQQVKEPPDKDYHGKQSLKKLAQQNVQLSNIEITDNNIKAFEKVAKKYGIDFSLKRDKSEDPPRYFVFFKARDVDVMTAAFREFTGKTLNKTKKPSVRKKLQQAIAARSQDKQREREKSKRKTEGADLMSGIKNIKKKLKGFQVRPPNAEVIKKVLLHIPYMVVFYVVNKCTWLYQYCRGSTVVDRLMVLLMNYPLAFKKLLPSIQPKSLVAGTIAAVSVWAVVYFKGKNGKKFRQGEEYGSARWGNEKDIAPFIDPVFENNILLTQTERLTMNSRPKKPKYARTRMSS